mmetsp:Transcript_19937/g.79771  ORF Transcript_19937/g.79771 Transcript_19937/m.79771 type:complete len:110 (-) Transcript_19937:2207-2536(-)
MFRDILEGLGANLVFGEGKAMDVPLLLEDLRIVSERIDTMIDRVENNPLVAIGRSRAELKKHAYKLDAPVSPKFLLITAKDRVDIVLTITSLSATRKYGKIDSTELASG